MPDKGDEVYPPGQSQANLQDSFYDEGSGDENKERGNWTGKLDFLLSCLGYAVGLGNVWRFPYLVGKNGGGAFLIPYFIMLIFVGIPIFFLELSLGQFSSSGPTMAFNCSPLFKGIGWGMVVVSGLINLEYNMIITYTLYYMFAGFQSVLPWSTCGNEWNDDRCQASADSESCAAQDGMYYYKSNCADLNSTVGRMSTENVTGVNFLNTSEVEGEVGRWFNDDSMGSTEQYFNMKVLKLHLADGMENVGTVNWDLLLCLLLGWIIVFLCLIKGVKSSGKVVYFTATFPYLVLVILLIRGVTLDGHELGVEFYMSANWTKLSEPGIWSDAAGQIFFSLSCSMGGLMTLASYNRFQTNVVRDTLLVTLGNCMTSFFAGFVIFSILGFMAKSQGVSVDKVAASGTGLAFIAYPEVVTKLAVAPLWSFIFFFMLLTLGLDSQFAGVETVATGIMDIYPKLREKKTFLMLGICVVSFIVGIVFTTDGGIYIQNWMDSFAAGWSLVVIALCDVIVITYVYGLKKFHKDVEMMIGSDGRLWNVFRKYIMATWYVITPLLLLFVLIFSFINYSPLVYGNGVWEYVFPEWANGLGWIVAMMPIILIVVFGSYEIWKQLPDADGNVFQAVLAAARPADTWGPALDKFRTGRYAPFGQPGATGMDELENGKYTKNGSGMANDGYNNGYKV